MNYKCVCEFNGTSFKGWQSQPSQNTVQDNLEHALIILFKQKTPVVGVGRTDAGVSAYNYIFNFKTNKIIKNKEKFLYSFNGLINKDIHIKSIQKTRDNFNSRFDCKYKTYKYFVFNDISVLKRNSYWEVQGKLNIKKIQKFINDLQGKHDFTSFCKQKSLKENTIINLMQSKIMKNGKEIIFVFTGDRFLHNMIRLIVGTAIYIGQDKIRISGKKILKKKNIKYAGKLAPAKGLLFYKAYY